MSWKNGLAEWVEGDTAYISVVFSWMLPQVFQKCIWYKSNGYIVRVGGPALFASKKYLDGVAEIGGEVDALTKHNADATIASRGCPVGCYFCIVPKMEGKEFTLIPDFIPRPILCDNNLSALPVDYQNFIIDKYIKFGVELLDANSGFEPKMFDKGTYNRWKKINKGPWRFALDEAKEIEDVVKTMKILEREPQYKKRVYVLIGNEPKEACFERVQKVIELGGEPHVQPMIALNALEKKPMVRYDWTEQELKNMARWANRWIWRKISYSDYKNSFRNNISELENQPGLFDVTL